MNDIVSNEYVVILTSARKDRRWDMQELVLAIERIGQSTRELAHEVKADA